MIGYQHVHTHAYTHTRDETIQISTGITYDMYLSLIRHIVLQHSIVASLLSVLYICMRKTRLMHMLILPKVKGKEDF